MIGRLPLRAMPLLACLLVGCSAQLLEDVGEVSVPRPCTEITKLFGTFSMSAKSISWKGDKGDPAAMLTLALVFDNHKAWPIALSNSGNGVLYAVAFSLQGEKGSFPPKEAVGVALVREPRQFTEPRRSGPFAAPSRAKSSSASPAADKTVDVNQRIEPGKPAEGKLVFQAPRDNYLLIIERKFDGRPVRGQPSDHIAACKIPVG
jgi:hypothetical protein